MKKSIVWAMVLCMLLMIAAAAMAEKFTVTPNPPKGIDYSYKYASLLFRDGMDVALMDKYAYHMSAAAVAENGDVYVPLQDLAAMYAPDFTVEEEGTKLTLNHFGLTVVLDTESADAMIDGYAYTFTNAPRTIDGIMMVPVLELCGKGFGTPVATVGSYYAVSYTTNDLPSFGRDMTAYDSLLRSKEYGFIYKTYTIPDDPDQKVLPLRLYIPSSYDPEQPMRTIVLLHGRSVSMNYFFPDTQDAIKYYAGIETFAEKNGYILIAGTAYLVNGDYGNVDGLPYMVHSSYTQKSDREKELCMRSEASVFAGLDLVMSQYNIDKDHLYLMGNSMGGVGTFFLGNKYSDMWDAIVPSGMTLNIELIGENPYPNLVDMPIFYTEGSEDNYGWDLAAKNIKLLKGYLNNLTFNTAAGGVHNTGWCIALPEVFEFLNAQY